MVGDGEGLGEIIEQPVHVGEPAAVCDLAEAGPFGKPAVECILGIAALGQAEGVPLPALPQLEDYRTLVPPKRPQAVVARRKPAQAARTGNLGERRALDHLPLPVPIAAVGFRQAARGTVEIRVPGVAPPSLAVVGHDELARAGGGPFAVGPRVGAAEQAVKLVHGQRVHVHLIQLAFHADEIHLGGGGDEVPGVARDAQRHAGDVHRAHLPGLVNKVRPDNELPRLGMDHAVGVSAAHAFGPHLQLQVLIHRVEFVLAPLGAMGRIGNEPELVRPGHNRADAALAVGIEHRQVRIYAADAHNLVVRRWRPDLGDSRGRRNGSRGPGTHRQRTWADNQQGTKAEHGQVSNTPQSAKAMDNAEDSACQTAYRAACWRGDVRRPR